ncbi:hypothetical protein J4732_12140 [Serratia marcescens]|uniref:Uncharacterized protein n=1 Tax=Serratia marcescens TaxID=615 RepID=A0A939NRI9_SERMA|nr:hypothetical protein [Serratia marcescens]
MIVGAERLRQIDAAAPCRLLKPSRRGDAGRQNISKVFATKSAGARAWLAAANPIAPDKVLPWQTSGKSRGR